MDVDFKDGVINKFIQEYLNDFQIHGKWLIAILMVITIAVSTYGAYLNKFDLEI